MKLTEWKELVDKFSKKESWDKEFRYIAKTRLIFGLIFGSILGTLFGLLLSYLFLII